MGGMEDRMTNQPALYCPECRDCGPYCRESLRLVVDEYGATCPNCDRWWANLAILQLMSLPASGSKPAKEQK
jgi:hypothetical protein